MKFVIYGEPKAKKRHKTFRRGNYVGQYNPSVEDENNIRSQLIPHKPNTPLVGSLKLRLNIYKKIPKSFSKKKRIMAEKGEIRPDGRPDLDNYIKLFKDAANSILWKDDSQIVEYLPGTGKYYSETPRWEVELVSIEEQKRR